MSKARGLVQVVFISVSSYHKIISYKFSLLKSNTRSFTMIFIQMTSMQYDI